MSNSELRWRRAARFAMGAVLVVVCGGANGCPTGCRDDGGDSGPADARFVRGCPSLVDKVAQPGDPIDGDTWVTFAQPFFEEWCVRCHSSTLSGDDRNGAPIGYNWDVEATVRDHLPEIRSAVGVINFMPFNPPDPTCAEREQLVRWIDADAP